MNDDLLVSPEWLVSDPRSWDLSEYQRDRPGRRDAVRPRVVVPPLSRPRRHAPRRRRLRGLFCRADELGSEIGAGTKLLDVRSDAEWQGSNTFDHRRVGHIPGATHVVWSELLAPQEPYVFRTPDEIRALLGGKGITPKDRVVTVCEVGWRAAHSAFALRLAGFSDVRVYDASMREWDDREDLPLDPPAAQ